MLFQLTAIFSLRSLPLMLAASMTVPNPPQDNKQDKRESPPSHRPPPIPQNWRGVGQGLKDATDLLQRHLYTQAEQSLLQLLEFAPMEGKVWHLLGRCHQARKQHARALECFEHAASCYRNQNSSDAPPVSARLARLLWDQGEKDAARAMLEQLLMREPGDEALLAMQHDWQQPPTSDNPCNRQEGMA
jgi:tetratricopeptide (TPR) repeat protein